MIRYSYEFFGYRMLFRLHGSAVFKSLIPSLLSSAIYLILWNTTCLQQPGCLIMDHPYPIGALIAALTFLLSFRANFSYNRFWEAMTSVYQMHSKWLDVGMELAAFHLQSSAYDGKKPPAFGAHPQLTSIERARERLNETTLEELQHMLEETATPNNDQSLRTRVNSFIKKKTPQDITSKINNSAVVKSINRRHTKPQALKKKTNFFTRLYGGSNPKETDMKCTTNYQTSKIWEEDKPPLFLQEGAHLLSLLSAVACSTLRNDLEQADSPLITFVPNEPWPAVDPDDIDADTRKDWTRTDFQSCSNLKYLVGHTRTPAARTLYNAARPFRVVGGVSDAEIELLQAARGPLAKVALVSMWLQEFISREYLHGSTGKVAPPILSRLYQYVSDGMLGYNQARKVAYIPFPFPHAQITSLFVLVVVGFMPILMITFIDGEAFGLILNLLTVMCFTGLHEVARELENPFQNVPNDIPLNNLQAQFNESLMTMFTGYHPDAYWEISMEQETAREEEKES